MDFLRKVGLPSSLLGSESLGSDTGLPGWLLRELLPPMSLEERDAET